jgi:hypothetical protein
VDRLTPNSSAFANAPSRIFTKNGFVSVFVIKQAEMPWPPANAVVPTDIIAATAAPVSSFFMISSQGDCAVSRDE